MAVRDISTMPAVMDRYAKSIEGAVEHAVHVLVETALLFFAEGTPVDTNRAVSNWRVSIGSPVAIYAPTMTPGAMGGAGADAVKAAVVAGGNTTIKQWKLKGNQKLFVQNNAPYIMKLERGHSRAQGGGFIASGLQAMLHRATQIKILKQLD